MPASGPDVFSLLHLCRCRLQPFGHVACDHRSALRRPHALIWLKILHAEVLGVRQGPALPLSQPRRKPKSRLAFKGGCHASKPCKPSSAPDPGPLIPQTSPPAPLPYALPRGSAGDWIRPQHSRRITSPHLHAPPAAFSQPCSIPTPRPCPLTSQR